MYSANCANSPQFGRAIVCYDTTVNQWYYWQASSLSFQLVSSGGTLPASGNTGNILVDNGATLNGWGSYPTSGDVSSLVGALGSLDLVAQETLPYTGSALSSSISGQLRETDGSGHMVVATTTVTLPVLSVGSPSNSAVYQIAVPYALKFNANFATSTGIPAAIGGCVTAPSETDDYQISCPVGGAMTHIGDVSFASNCDNVQMHPPTFTTVSGTAKSCQAGMYQVAAPSPATGANLTASIVGHN